jgi:hypothetical protein
MKRVVIPILMGNAITLDNTLGGNKSEIYLTPETASRAWLFSVYDDNGKKMKRTRIKIDDNIYIATITPEEVSEIIDNNRERVGFKNKVK